MTLEELRNELDRRFIRLWRNNDYVEYEALFPEQARLTDELRDQLREHKPELLERLAFEEGADALVLESSRRLAALWPRGCPLEGEEWRRLDEELTKAYRAADRNTLMDALEEREKHALEAFRRYQGAA